jgi:hypothetical protein
MTKSTSQLIEETKNISPIDDNVKSMTMDKMSRAAKEENEPLAKIAQSDIDKCKDIYLKPIRYVSSREKFNEKWREDYNYAMENVRFVAEHRELIGENAEFWTKPFPGMPAEEWSVPTGKPVWAPRHVAERLTKCSYHRLMMEQNTITSEDGMGKWTGGITVDKTIQRLDALPVSNKRSIFMGANSF